MRKAQKHQDDKYSPSLHLVDAQSGTRFSDDSGPVKEGAPMRSNEKGHESNSPAVGRDTLKAREAKRVAHVRELRRAAARRRSVIAASLAVVSIIVLVIAFPLHFSPLFALIPAALLALVLVAGARAAKHARQWERNLKSRNAAKGHGAKSHADKSVAQSHAAAERGEQVKTSVSAGDDQPTGTMEASEIRYVVERSKIQSAEVKKRSNKSDAGKGTASKVDNSASGSTQSASTKLEAKAKNVVEGKSKPKNIHSNVSASDSANKIDQAKTVRVKDTAAGKSGKSGASHPVVKVTGAAKATLHQQASRVEQASDATNELPQIHSAGALNVVDMAPTNQDLISFSLGAPRNPQAATQEPQSLEIKSTRQVAKAVPQKTERATADKSGAKTAKAYEAKSGKQSEAVKAKSVAANFHDAELSADVEAPAVSSDSLGTGLESILARRGA